MKIYKEGHSFQGYGRCWIEGDGVRFWVCVLGGQSKYGPYSSLSDAKKEFSKWCAK